MESALEFETPHGPARVHLHPVADPVAALVLGHGAGGGVGAPDLVAATEVAVGAGLFVALVEQPYRVAGRRSAAPARQLDAAWAAVVAQLAAGPLAGLPLIVGGRSSGARVACRTADAVGAIGVLCMAFPTHPPGKGDDPSKSRQFELDAVAVPTLVVQGATDPFGRPEGSEGHRVEVVRGDHGLKADLKAVRAAVGGWLAEVVRAR
jgi:predicted alpha/beta-hydrolase family hydrolase